MATAPDGRTILETPPGPWSDDPYAHLDLLVDALIAHGNRVKSRWEYNRDGALITLKKKIDWELLNQLFVIPSEIEYQDRGKYNLVHCNVTNNGIMGGV